MTFKLTLLKAVNYSKYTSHDLKEHRDLSLAETEVLEKFADEARKRLFTKNGYKLYNTKAR